MEAIRRVSAGLILLLAAGACGEERSDVGVAGEVPLEEGSVDLSGNPARVAAVIRNQQGEEIGEVSLTDDGGGVFVSIVARELPPGERGLHFHEVGRCDPPDHQSAGSHFNPEGREEHGLDSAGGGHAGDMRNLTVGADGTAQGTQRNQRVTLQRGAPNSLLDEDGSALIIHENADDHTATSVTGARIACAVITEG